MPTQTAATQTSLELFETYKHAINQALAEYFEHFSKQYKGIDLPLIATQALELMQEHTLRPGKRVRGALAAMVYDQLTGKRLSQAGLRLAVVMELLQSYILIIDDVTDKSDLRRGEPTVHRQYEQVYKGKVGEREAEQLALYTGLILGHIANVTLLDANESQEHINNALRYIHENIILTGFGQLDDIMQEIGRQASRDDIIRKYALKTSHYTFTNPLQSGMALAGMTDETVYRQVAAFGEPAGIAFQTHDDYLGVFGGSDTGKPNTDDIQEGKLTVLTEHALNHASVADREQLKQFLGNPDVGQKELQIVQQIFDRSGATMEARQTAQTYAKKAIEQLKAVSVWDDSFKSALAELVMYSIQRKS